MKSERSRPSHDGRWRAVIVAAIAMAQAALILVVVLAARHLPESTRSAVVVVLSLLIWAEALWASYRVASRATRRILEHGDEIGGDDGERGATGTRTNKRRGTRPDKRPDSRPQRHLVRSRAEKQSTTAGPSGCDPPPES